MAGIALLTCLVAAAAPSPAGGSAMALAVTSTAFRQGAVGTCQKRGR